ncbi:MAG: MotA/TolQ/ExbB proton channel family protein [Prevotella pallens]|jgi:motA/tolQ/exbB proton channel family protein|uniref:MotA/TolQ/ExbB proton channel family protein n=1 Tax=Prevotella pallens TaxID=60133 RepID=UPI000F2CB7AE|nr:MotA/TolQ/ExbB proton channel family protein [Prevotella pallens]RKW48638.1 MAG: MotA/TolQ/ExbB proton channel family protein [Prevotella sp.]MBF1443764.1 MotA/TolQ/ExbB proton channel family protein [Prevotella pallens]MBF1458977.1 MotA/TolQ/ExbB proton channel family protein [Prevotella pallens]MBF1462377.1 MotA/TolQ/ExbB proton channel family protein [Prevotella pallens]MBF1466964.1 MotA/TolQ/ExbB proton channel family protein [Prevotella pallens]
MNYITDILYWISSGLLVPVVLLLIFFFLRSLLLLGGFFSQYLTMRKSGIMLQKEVKQLSSNNLSTLAERLPKGKLPVVTCISKMLENRNSPAKVTFLLDEYECMVERELETPKMFTKMGPMLGLMGTLIPMGPALVGLSSGDIASMAYNMQVAFATTVIGLFAGGIGFVVKAVKQRWYRRDMGMLNYIADMLDENRDKQL